MAERWFAGYCRGNCTVLAETETELPTVCPKHGEPRTARPEPVEVVAGLPLGYVDHDELTLFEVA